jgi:hypothetical protein
MQVSLKNITFMAVLVGACWLTPFTAARADFSLTLSEAGYSDQTITFAPGPDNPQPGTAQVLIFQGDFGGFTYLLEAATSNSNLADQAPSLSLTNLQLSTNDQTAQTLTITVQDTGFSTSSLQGANSVDLVSQFTITTLPTDSSATFQSFLGNTAGQVLSPVTTDAAGVVTSTSTPAPSGMFTLKNVTTITMKGAGLVQTQGNTQVVAPPTTGGNPQVLAPEPGTMGAVFSALPLLVGLGLWRRRSQRLQLAASRLEAGWPTPLI